MSSLINALRKIENQSEQETILLPQGPPPSGSFKKNNRRPYLKIFGIAFLSICTGLAILGLIWLKSDDLLKAKSWLAGQIAQDGQISQAVILPEKEAALPPLETKTEKEAIITPNSLLSTPEGKKPSVIMAEVTAPPPQPVQSIPEKEIEKTILSRSDDLASRVRNKKMLYQAEQRRNQGDVTAAVKIYRKVWKIAKEPAVANNLAAGLLELEQYEEAALIIQQALVFSPDDPDLLYNLEIARTTN